jgi:5-formyltetrahydrofolate cyclo-ligase
MDIMFKNKSEIRKEFLHKRSLLTKSEIEENSSMVLKRVYDLEEYKKSRVIMCYMDFNNEIKTEDFIRKSLHLGKKVSIPRLEKNKNGNFEIKAIFIENIINDLKEGKYGILEPRSYIENEANYNEIDIAFVPGIAFERENKNRIGFGKGYYDEYFNRFNNNITKIGIAYDFQIVNFFESIGTDVAMNKIVTEKRVI